MAKVSFYLDSRKNGVSVKLRVTSNCQQRKIGLGIHLDDVNQWRPDDPSGPVVGHPYSRRMNAVLSVKIAAANDVLLDFASRNRSAAPAELFDAVEQRLDSAKAEQNRLDRESAQRQATSVLIVWKKFQDGKSGRTWELYHETLRRICRFVAERSRSKATEPDAIVADGMKELAQMQFEDITLDWLDSFDRWLARSRGVNARSIDLRNLRAVCMYAWKYEYTEAYIFRRWKIRKEDGSIEPLTPQQFREVFTFPLTEGSPLRMYRDIALLGFLLIGINIVDMHGLLRTDLRNGYLYYTRAKTHRRYCIRVEPEAEYIINKYKGEVHLLSWADRYRTHQSFAQHLNEEGLQRIGPTQQIPVKYHGHSRTEYRPLVPGLTYYQLRHTWACFAADLDIPKDTIALCLGHGRKTVTDVYVRYDQSKIDEANRRVIDYAMNLLAE